MPRRVVLISDLPQGSRLDALGDFEWPSDVELDLKTVADTARTRACSGSPIRSRPDPAEPARAGASGSSTTQSSRREKFELLWVDDKGAGTGKPIDVYVPPGESRVVQVPRPARSGIAPCAPAAGRRARLRQHAVFRGRTTRGDDRPLHRHRSRRRSRRPSLLPRARLRRHAPADRAHRCHSFAEAVWLGSRTTAVPLVIVTAETSAENARGLEQYVRSGGTVLYVVTAPGRAETLAALAGVPPWNIEEAAVGATT